MAQILGHLPVGLLELHRGTNEHHQLRHRQIHLAGGGENGGGHKDEQTTHTTSIVSQVGPDTFRTLPRGSPAPAAIPDIGSGNRPISPRWEARAGCRAKPRTFRRKPASRRTRDGKNRRAGAAASASLSVNSSLVTGCGRGGVHGSSNDRRKSARRESAPPRRQCESRPSIGGRRPSVRPRRSRNRGSSLCERAAVSQHHAETQAAPREFRAIRPLARLPPSPSPRAPGNRTPGGEASVRIWSPREP